MFKSDLLRCTKWYEYHYRFKLCEEQARYVLSRWTGQKEFCHQSKDIQLLMKIWNNPFRRLKVNLITFYEYIKYKRYKKLRR